MNARPRQTETSTELTPRERYQNTLAVVEYQTPGLDAPLLQEGIGSV